MRLLKIIILAIAVLFASTYLGEDLKNFFLSSLDMAQKYFPAYTSTSTALGKNNSLPEVQNFKQIEIPEDSSKSTTSLDVISSFGVFKYTNEARLLSGLPKLSNNTKLSLAALAKADDMFAKGYFEHISPSGVGPADVVKREGYEYLSIGENLAMGIFKNDRDLVDDWMASPGHRANILGKHFTEIGIAVKKGMYQGKEIWMAVQEFGTPSSLCEKADTSLLDKTSAILISLDSLKKELSDQKNIIDRTDKTSSGYNALVTSYNNMVKEYNSKALNAQNISDTYNQEVKKYNTCLASYTI